MRKLMMAFSAALLMPAIADAQSSTSMCQNMIDKTEAELPALAKRANADKGDKNGNQQLKAAKSALEAARTLQNTDQGSCLTMVNAAQTVLARADLATMGNRRSVIDLQTWKYDTLYKNSWRAEALIDQTAYNAGGQEVGDVRDILMKPDGTITAVIIEGGGFLDIGDRHVRVGWKDLKFKHGGEEGVVVPLDKGNMTDFTLFGADEKSGPRIGDNEVRMSSVLNKTVRLKDGEAVGYIEDILVSNGKINAVLVRPDVAYNAHPRPFAAPYYAYEYGYSPGYDYFVLPYDRSQLSHIDGFDTENVTGPSPESEPGKES